jgi:hypothetical protein
MSVRVTSLAVCLDYAALWLPDGPFLVIPSWGRWFSKASNRGEWMAYATRKAESVPSAARGFSLSGTIALGVVAFALASGAAVWTEDFDALALVSGAASVQETNPTNIDGASFDDRFLVGSTRSLFATNSPPRSLVRSLPSELDFEFLQAKGRLTEKLRSQDWHIALIEESKPSSVLAVPLPRSRPVEANLESLPRSRPAEPNLEPRNDVANARAESRTLLEKLSDLLPGRVTLASLAPDGGLFGKRSDLASLGYDNFTAVYDISAHAVYMPDGSKLEAHSGFGSLMDDPAHVNEQNVGATPPNMYDLKPREALFHGVQALRMIPVGDNDTLGRSGLLAHNYMLGPNGDSNGCVSIKNYEKFLNAFTKGEIRRLAVVPRLRDEKSAPRQST